MLLPEAANKYDMTIGVPHMSIAGVEVQGIRSYSHSVEPHPFQILVVGRGIPILGSMAARFC